ncbi:MULTISPECIES: hypothetical protein [Anaeromyxobacter]|uniref:hypothetical protein n=1 Tax=Anaeromyxobacter TaxID=161492 RepID=UPI001F576CA7|nr:MULTISPECIES: hypothetical protein [unclassified Anaeromyxobacter]
MRQAPLAALALAAALGPLAASADDETMRAAHEAVREALLERASLPERPPSLPDGDLMAPGARAERERREEASRAAHDRAARHGEQQRARHVGRDRDHGADAGHRSGMHPGDSAGDCRDAAGAVRTREMHGGMEGGHMGGGMDGGHMGGR